MTLNQLRAFLLAARTGSFTAAADELGVSQSSVSELIRRLEEEHSVTLFHRGGRRLVATAAAEELLPYAEQSVAAADGASQALRAVGSLRGGVATFGMLRNADYYLLSDLVERFHAKHPAVRLRLVGLNSLDVAAAVAEGTLEAGLVVLPIDDAGLQVTPLARDEVVYATAHPRPAATPVTIEELAAARLILYDAHAGWKDPTRRQLAERSQLAGCRLEPLIEVEHVEAALNLVARGLGDTIVPRAVARSAACPKSVMGWPFAERLYDTIALIRRASAPLSPAAREIARMARDMLRASGAELAEEQQEGPPSRRRTPDRSR